MFKTTPTNTVKWYFGVCKSRDVSNKTSFGEIAEFQNDQALNHPPIEFSPEHPGAFEKKSWISLKYPKEITKIPHLSHFMRNKIRHMTSRFTQINTACKETTRCFQTPILGLAPSPPRMQPRMTEDSGKNRYSTKGVHHLVAKVFGTTTNHFRTRGGCCFGFFVPPLKPGGMNLGNWLSHGVMSN